MGFVVLRRPQVWPSWQLTLTRPTTTVVASGLCQPTCQSRYQHNDYGCARHPHRVQCTLCTCQKKKCEHPLASGRGPAIAIAEECVPARLHSPLITAILSAREASLDRLPVLDQPCRRGLSQPRCSNTETMSTLAEFEYGNPNGPLASGANVLRSRPLRHVWR